MFYTNVFQSINTISIFAILYTTWLLLEAKVLLLKLNDKIDVHNGAIQSGGYRNGHRILHGNEKGN